MSIFVLSFLSIVIMIHEGRTGILRFEFFIHEGELILATSRASVLRWPGRAGVGGAGRRCAFVPWFCGRPCCFLRILITKLCCFEEKRINLGEIRTVHVSGWPGGLLINKKGFLYS